MNNKGRKAQDGNQEEHMKKGKTQKSPKPWRIMLVSKVEVN